MTEIHKTPAVAEQPRNISSKANRILYSLFVFVGAGYWIFSSDKLLGTALFGLALIFDPFDQKMTFSQRPLYQRAWLIVHVVIILVLFAIAIL